MSPSFGVGSVELTLNRLVFGALSANSGSSSGAMYPWRARLRHLQRGSDGDMRKAPESQQLRARARKAEAIERMAG